MAVPCLVVAGGFSSTYQRLRDVDCLPMVRSVPTYSTSELSGFSPAAASSAPASASASASAAAAIQSLPIVYPAACSCSSAFCHRL